MMAYRANTLITLILVLSIIDALRLQMVTTSPSGFQQLLKHNPNGLRLFHPAFPLELLKPISRDEADHITRTKQLMGVAPKEVEEDEKTKLLHSIQIGNKKKYLPWYSMPNIGVPDATSFMSSLEIAEAFEKEKHKGQLVWAYTMDKPKKDCLLLNHWEQRVVYLADYNANRGAQGYEFNHLASHDPALGAQLTWSPLALEFELTDGLWQPVCVSENIINGSVMNLLPRKLGSKAFWEFIMLLLVSDKNNPDIIQAFMDTGLSPEKGLIAYLRLLRKILQRTSTYDDIPDYRKISEKDIVF